MIYRGTNCPPVELMKIRLVPKGAGLFFVGAMKEDGSSAAKFELLGSW